MECSRIRNNLAEYVDGDLPPRERLLTEQHLYTCMACRRELDVLTAALDRCAALLQHPGPEDRLAALRGQMAAADHAAARKSRVRAPLELGAVLRGVAVAAVLALAAAAVLPLLEEGPGRHGLGGVMPAGMPTVNGPVQERLQLLVNYLNADSLAVRTVSLEGSAVSEGASPEHQ